MIEVEKKYILTDENREKLTHGAMFLGEKIFTDIYYDTNDYALTTQDTWLRQRAGRHELKIPLHEVRGKGAAHQYRELETDAEIAAYLQFDESVPLAENLEAHDYAPFCRFVNTRQKYKNGEFTIDIDSVDFGFERIEVELLVEDISRIKEANDKIIAFARHLDLDETRIPGKMMEYLRRFRPGHYQALAEAKVWNRRT